MAVCVDPPRDLAKMRTSVGARFDFLSDPEGTLLDLFGIRHRGGGPGGDVAQSASFLLDRQGRLVWSRDAENYRIRPRPDEILTAADALPA